VITTEPNANLALAVKLLATHRVGALVVVGPNQRVAGIISEHDIIRVLADRGAAALEQPVEQVITHKLVTPRRTISNAMELMTAGKFSTSAGRRGRPVDWHRFDRRRRKASRAGNRVRIRDLAGVTTFAAGESNERFVAATIGVSVGEANIGDMAALAVG
jgi:CBS domain-containing protein